MRVQPAVRMLEAAGHAAPARRTTACARPGAGGFTLLELLVVTGILAILFALVVGTFARLKKSARTVTCLSNLRQIVGGFQQYAATSNGRLPNPLAADLSWEQILRRHVGSAHVFRCPADDELADLMGSSYDWRDTGDANTTMAGRPLAEADARTVLAFDSLPNWHAEDKMNAGFADGSAATLDAQQCLGNVMSPLRADPAAAVRRRGNP